MDNVQVITKLVFVLCGRNNGFELWICVRKRFKMSFVISVLEFLQTKNIRIKNYSNVFV